ncbi:MAG: 8-amino-7-oxononanoate synthase [Blastocatellia bacterium]|nr:MAG: 8-amino-7-oxononanoate synthase [Blastocatellia bacterium]
MATNDGLRSRVAQRMAAIRAAQTWRTLQSPSGIDLCSNDYLALSKHPHLKERMIDAVRHEGCGSTGSRLLRGERDCFGEVERRFAVFKRTERSLYFSSGYLANVAVLTTLPEPGDVIFSDERNHASLIDGIRLSSAARVVFPHNDVQTLTSLLGQHHSKRTFIVTESLFSMDGDLAPLTAYAALCRLYGSSLIVDEAHAVGVYGADGAGLIDPEIADDVVVSVNTAGKALGVSGAFVAGPSWAIEYLIQLARPFMFSTAPPPPVAGALQASLDLVESEPERRQTLARLSRNLRSRLVEAGIPVPHGPSHIIPIVLGDNHRASAVADRLRGAGFDVRAIRPPSVPLGTARLRIALNVGISDAVIDQFVRVLAAAVNETIPWPAVSS